MWRGRWQRARRRRRRRSAPTPAPHLAPCASLQGEAAKFGIAVVRAPLAPTVPGGLVSRVHTWQRRAGVCGGADTSVAAAHGWWADPDIGLGTCQQAAAGPAAAAPPPPPPAPTHPPPHTPLLPHHTAPAGAPRVPPPWQAMSLQDPGLKFGTRQQAVRDAPWGADWGGTVFQVVRR